MMPNKLAPPSLKEQNYFAHGGMGPKTAGMQAQGPTEPTEADWRHYQMPDAMSGPSPYRGGAQAGKAVFVDQITDGMAVVLVDDIPRQVPVDLLPPGIREGSWIDLSDGSMQPTNPYETAGTDAMRRKMGASDPGGSINLGRDPLGHDESGLDPRNPKTTEIYDQYGPFGPDSGAPSEFRSKRRANR